MSRCICPGLNIDPDCPLHNYNPAEDEPEGLAAFDIQSELERLEIDDADVAAASAGLDAVYGRLKARLPSDLVDQIYSEPVLRDPYDMDDDERRGH